jgi:hypothetical protein
MLRFRYHGWQHQHQLHPRTASPSSPSTATSTQRQQPWPALQPPLLARLSPSSLRVRWLTKTSLLARPPTTCSTKWPGHAATSAVSTITPAAASTPSKVTVSVTPECCFLDLEPETTISTPTSLGAEAASSGTLSPETTKPVAPAAFEPGLFTALSTTSSVGYLNTPEDKELLACSRVEHPLKFVVARSVDDYTLVTNPSAVPLTHAALRVCLDGSRELPCQFFGVDYEPGHTFGLMPNFRI